MRGGPKDLSRWLVEMAIRRAIAHPRRKPPKAPPGAAAPVVPDQPSGLNGGAAAMIEE